MNRNTFTRTVLLLLLSLGMSFDSYAETITVEKNDIIGTWENRDGEFARGKVTYMLDGTWEYNLIVIFPGELAKKVKLKGTWKMDGNRLFYKSTWSSDERFPLYSGFDVIIAVTQNRFDYNPRGRDEILSLYRVE